MSSHLHDRLRALRSAQERVQPDEAWVQATRNTLLMQVKNSLPPQPVRATATVSYLYRHFSPLKYMQWLRAPLAATLSVLVVVMGSSVASVSAAERSLPGDFLYSLKLATEQARLALTSVKEDKLKLKLEFTTRRGEDLKQVAKTETTSKPGRVAQAAEILKRDLKTVKDQLEDVKTDPKSESGKVVEVAKLVDQKTNELVQSLQLSKLDLSAETKEKLTEAQAAAADTGVKAIEVLVEQHQESSEKVSETEVAQAIQDHTRTIADATVEGSLTVSSTSPVLTITSVGTSTAQFTEAVEQIKSASLQAFAAQKTVEQAQAVTAAASSTTAALPGTSATSSGVTTSPTTSTTSVGASKTSTSTVTPP